MPASTRKELIAISGYANRVKRLGFPDLTEPGETELHIVLRNPKTMTVDELMPQDVPTDTEGKPLDQELAAERTREIIARLIIGWRMYDASDVSLDDNGNPLDQQLLPLPATPALVRKLPTEAVSRINDEIMAAVDPQ